MCSVFFLVNLYLIKRPPNSTTCIHRLIDCFHCPYIISTGKRKTETFLAFVFLQSVEELPESLRSLVYHGTFSTAAAQLGLTMISILSLIVSSICLFVMFLSRRRKPCCTIKKNAAGTELKPQLSWEYVILKQYIVDNRVAYFDLNIICRLFWTSTICHRQKRKNKHLRMLDDSKSIHDYAYLMIF